MEERTEEKVVKTETKTAKKAKEKKTKALKPVVSKAEKRERKCKQLHERHMHLLVLGRRKKEKARRKAARKNRK